MNFTKLSRQNLKIMRFSSFYPLINMKNDFQNKKEAPSFLFDFIVRFSKFSIFSRKGKNVFVSCSIQDRTQTFFKISDYVKNLKSLNEVFKFQSLESKNLKPKSSLFSMITNQTFLQKNFIKKGMNIHVRNKVFYSKQSASAQQNLNFFIFYSNSSSPRTNFSKNFITKFQKQYSFGRTTHKIQKKI